jgi:hypothetical protein
VDQVFIDNNMNKLELFFYNLVKNNPRLKRRIRDAYQGVFDLVPVKRTESVYPIEVREGFFFGFHDNCPWSPDNQLLLAHRINHSLRMPRADDAIEVGYFYGPNYRDFRAMGTTRTWNWHQGSMLQWVGNFQKIIFNDFDGEKHIAKIVNTDGKLFKELSFPVAAVSPDGKDALSFNFARLRNSPHGYSYANGEDPEEGKLIPAKTGISLIDIPSGKVKLLFTVSDIARIKPEPSMNGAFHYLSHCQFSPSGQRFVFSHRWLKNNNRERTRRVSSDLTGRDIFVFPTSEMASHTAWQDKENILIYARTQKYGDKYYLFKDKTNQFSIIGEESFNSDGHPCFSKDGRWILTDTYPDRFRIRYLILYDLKNRKRYNIAKLYSPREYVGKKFEDILMCDLHPRWNRNNTMICFDSAHTGKRSLCTITVGDLNKKEPSAI